MNQGVDLARMTHELCGLRVVFLSLVVLLSACATTKVINIQSATPSSSHHSDVAMAGAVSVDITPPPGMPMGGYSIMANKGVGFRTRLKARIIYVADDVGGATALIQTDLTAGSLLLHHKIASAVAKRTGLKPGDIVIAASHSHSAPANIFDNDFYNKHMSSGKWLDERFLAFLSQQISEGIIEAYETRRPAKIAIGAKAIYGYNRNRSLAAYALNKNIGDIILEDGEAIYKAVNPTLNMIRVDVQNAQGNYLPLAAFSSFSVHATAMSPKVNVYNADLFAYAQKDLEWRVKKKYQTDWPIVHAFTTGTQGDMAPALTQDGDNYIRHFDLNWPEAKKLGQGIGSEAIQLFESLGAALSSDITLQTAAREINIRDNNVIGEVVLCKNAAVGAAVVGGAYERRTPWLSVIPFFSGGNIMSRRWFFTGGCQGNKSHAGFSFIQPLLEPKHSFPQVVMFQFIKINDAVILPLPFEVTVEAGRRIVSSVKSALTAADQVWIVGSANGYFGYSTTVEEYEQQNYEGGHTLYGRNTTPYLGAQLSKLTRDVLRQGHVHEMLLPWQYQLAVNQFYPEMRVSSGKRLFTMQPIFYSAREPSEESYIYVRWLDVGPSEIKFHKPLAKVQVQHNNSWLPLNIQDEPISDEGYDIEIRHLEEKNEGMAEYEVRWYNPVVGGRYRFVIEARGNQPSIRSKAFIQTLGGVL